MTGGSQGIGAAIVHAAREAGHQVVFTGRNQGHIDATVKATGAEGIKAELRQRLERRAEDSAETIEKRLANARTEIQRWVEYEIGRAHV